MGFALLLPAKKCKTGFRLAGSVSCCVLWILGRLGFRDSRQEGMPTITVLGASTMGRTSQGSPSVAVLPPDEGALLPDVDSVKSARSFSGSQSERPDASGMDVSSAALSSAVEIFSQSILLVDVTSNIHPFFTHRLDAGPIRLVTIAHAFNYWVAVLRDGVKLAARSAVPVKRRDEFWMIQTFHGDSRWPSCFK